MVGHTDGDNLRRHTAVGKAGPLLILILAADPEKGAEFDVRAHAAGVDGVADDGPAIGITEVAVSGHGFDIRDQYPVGAEVTCATVEGALVALVAGGAVDLVELRLDAQVRHKVEVGIGRESLESLWHVIGLGHAVVGADLEVAGARCRGDRLGEECRCSPEQER